MKILITTDWYKPIINGVVTSAANLVDELEALGHEVRILTLSNSFHSYEEKNITYVGSMGVEWVYPNARFRTALACRQVRRLADWKPDIVHSQCEFSTFFLARKIARMSGAPLVHTYHTVYEDFTHYFSPNVKAGKYAAAVFSRYILNKTQAVIAPTEKVKAMLMGYHVKTPVYTVPTGLELARFLNAGKDGKRETLRSELGIAAQETILVYVGRLAKEKNIEELFSLLKNQTEAGMRLLLVGDGPYRHKLEKTAEEMGLAGRILFTGMVAPENVAEYYRAGDIFICASQSEAQGLTYIEAMASALPVLCKYDPCLDGVIDHGHTGFVYATPHEFKMTLEKLLESPAYQKEIGEAARQSMQEHFSANSFARALLGIYSICQSEHAL